MQKKAYRVLEEMCGGDRDECRSFVVANLETLKSILLDTLKKASSPAKRVRLMERNMMEQTVDRPEFSEISSLISRFVFCVFQPRLKCLIHIVKRLSEEHKDFITSLLPEV